MNDFTFILLGVTGDLSRKKLLPALYHLIARKQIEQFVIVGAALGQADAAQLLAQVKENIGTVDEVIWKRLQERFFYESVNFTNETDFKTLSARVDALENQFGLSGNRMAYLAAAAEFFCPITNYLASSKLITRKKVDETPWQRIVYEKPFGHDLKSAHQINECIEKLFEEHQIYRIDHFLTKELVSNIALVRFTNCIFEPLWNNRYIDQVQIVINEEIALEGRGAYYDKYGALADVMQNHMLELLALIGMESPQKLTGDYVRDRRVQVLEKVEVVDGILGQYEGYKKDSSVPNDSDTETFAALMLRINNPRWAGVPFYLKTGKCLDKKETKIHIKFKSVDCLLTHDCPVPSNWLSFEVSPEATFSLSLNAKKPGRSEQVIPVAMEFCHSCLFGAQTPESYEVVIEEVIRGEKSISVRFDEIEQCWRIIDTVRQQSFPIHEYQCGSTGPEEIKQFEQKHGMRWRS
jgi:glucose-6-phosphate 1-dehydrogenase